MRKQLKQALSIVLSAAMVLTAGTGLSAKSAKAEDGTANSVVADFYYASQDWSCQVEQTVDVTGDGEYTIELTKTDDTAQSLYGGVFIMDLKEIQSKVSDFSAIKATNIKLEADGAEVALDQEKLQLGDVEGKGENYRIEIYNQYGPTKDDSPVAQDATWKSSLKLTFTLEGITWLSDATTAVSGSVSAKFYYASQDWSCQAEQTVDVTGDGEYTIELTKTDDTAQNLYGGVFIMDLEGIQSKVSDFSTVKATNIKLEADGAEVALDQEKLQLGDVEGKGENYRIEIYNQYGPTKDDSPVAQDATWKSSLKLTFTVEGIQWKAADAEPTEEPEATPEPTQDPGFDTPIEKAQEYHAYIGFQTGTNWLCRDAWFANQSDAAKAKSVNGYGLNATKVSTDNGDFDYDFTKQFYKTGDGSDTPQNKAGVYDAVFEDTTITENNKEYSVKMSGVDLSTCTEGFNMLYISTDIATTQENVVFSDATIIVDDKEVATAKLINKADAASTYGYYQMMAINIWGSAKDGTKVTMKDIDGMVMPSSSIELKFSVSGIDFDSEQTVITPQTFGLEKGATFTSGNFKYKVTTAAVKTGDAITTQGKVSVVGLSTKGKKAKSLSVPATVKKTATYKVTSVAANACKGAAATSVTLSKNIKSIKKGTFANCKKLSALTLKAKLSSVAKNSFKGCGKTIKVKGTSAKANVTKLKKSGYKKFK